MPDYRTRIYQSYVYSGPQTAVPTDVRDFGPRAAILRKLIQDHFPHNRNAAILDLGCGHGAVVYFAYEAGYRNIVGVDRSPEQVAIAQRLGIEGVQERDLMDFLASVPDESQEIVVCWDVIEHFTKEELVVFTDEVRRILQPAGKWIIHAPNGESPFGAKSFFGDFTHELAFTRRSISQLLLASSFQQVECFEDVPIPHGLKSAVRIVRFHNIFGPLGTWDGGREKAPAAMCRKVALAKLSGNPDIEIWGDGEQTRSFCYIDDCVTGLQKLMQSDYGQPLNLGQDRLITINQLADIVANIAGTPITKNHISGPQGVRGRNSDNSRLREVLGWEPTISLEEGLSRTYAWIEAQVRKN